MMSPISPRKAARSERGAELIEFALVFPLLLFVVLGIVDFGFLFQRMEVVTNAAREGARIAVLPGYSGGRRPRRGCASYVQGGGVPMTGAQCASAANINVTNTTITAGASSISGKQVTVSFPHQYLFIGGFASWIGGGSFGTVPVNATAVMRDEIAVAAGGDRKWDRNGRTAMRPMKWTDVAPDGRSSVSLGTPNRRPINGS